MMKNKITKIISIGDYGLFYINEDVFQLTIRSHKTLSKEMSLMSLIMYPVLMVFIIIIDTVMTPILLLNSLYIRKAYGKDKCPDCGWWIACPDCSKKYSKIDEELRAKGI